jgi:Family of unknown function (DUF6223)
MMKKRNGILIGLIAACAACVISAASCSQSSQTSNKPTQKTPTATVSVRYIVDGAADTGIEFYTKLTELARVRFFNDEVHAVVDFYNIHLGFATDINDRPIGITKGRARALVGAAVGLLSLVVGGLALARSAGRIGTGNVRTGAMVALALGLIGMVLGVVHLGTSTGGFGTGSGRAGAIVALVLGLIGMNLGGLALARSRRSRSSD